MYNCTYLYIFSSFWILFQSRSKRVKWSATIEPCHITLVSKCFYHNASNAICIPMILEKSLWLPHPQMSNIYVPTCIVIFFHRYQIIQSVVYTVLCSVVLSSHFSALYKDSLKFLSIFFKCYPFQSKSKKKVNWSSLEYLLGRQQWLYISHTFLMVHQRDSLEHQSSSNPMLPMLKLRASWR